MPVLMPSPVFRWFVPAQDGSGLVPAEGYKAKFYAAGTTTAKTIYEPDGTPYPSPSNVATLNAEGYAEIWLGDGSYKLVVTDPDDAEVYTLDNINGEGNFTSGFVDTVIATDDPPTNGLAQVDTSANHFVWCAGYWQIGDGGHGFFWNETSSAPDDTGYVIASTFDPTKRWYRVPDEDNGVRAQSFGYVGTINDDFTDQLLAACAFCTSYNKTLKIGPGSDATIDGGFATLDLYAPEFVFTAGSMLTAGTTVTEVHFHGRVSGTPEQHFTGFQAMFWDPQENAFPEWFGGSTGADNTTAFGKWFASLPNGGSFTLPPGTWPYNNTTAFPYPTVPFTLLGTIDATTGSDIPPGVYFPANSRFRLHKILFDEGYTLSSAPYGAAFDGKLAVTGDITTDAAISAVGSISSNGTITAGSGGNPGVVRFQAGSSSDSLYAGGQYKTVIQDATTSGTGATDLLSATIAAHAFIDVGAHVRVIAAGSASGGSAQNKNITVKIGSTNIATLTLSFQNEDWAMTIDFWITSTAAVYSTARYTAGTLTISDAINTISSLNFNASQTLQVVGTASVSGDMTQKMLSIEYFPAP